MIRAQKGVRVISDLPSCVDERRGNITRTSGELKKQVGRDHNVERRKNGRERGETWKALTQKHSGGELTKRRRLSEKKHYDGASEVQEWKIRVEEET